MSSARRGDVRVRSDWRNGHAHAPAVLQMNEGPKLKTTIGPLNGGMWVSTAAHTLKPG
jgi:hypothetical protein